MAKETENEVNGQLTFFDIFGSAVDIDRKYTVSEIDKAIKKLREAKHIAQKRESDERRRKEKKSVNSEKKKNGNEKRFTYGK